MVKLNTIILINYLHSAKFIIGEQHSEIISKKVMFYKVPNIARIGGLFLLFFIVSVTKNYYTKYIKINNTDKRLGKYT